MKSENFLQNEPINKGGQGAELDVKFFSKEGEEEERLFAADVFAKIRSGVYKADINKASKMARVLNAEDNSVILDTDLADYARLARLSHDTGEDARIISRNLEQKEDS